MLVKTVDIMTENSVAELKIFLQENSPEIDLNRKRPVVIICPGGGYEFTSDREAEPVAIQFLSMGFHVCILRYSVSPATFPTALLELSKTIAMIRDHAEKWHIDNDKVIVAGFSAGGHLAASSGVFWNQSFLSTALNVSNEAIKPNGLILSYPVITSGEYAHKNSFISLLAEDYNEKHNKVSLENFVTAQTPATFLWHTYTDEAVPVENSLLFANSLAKHKVPLEMHIYPKGVHGLSLGTEETKAYHHPATLQEEVSNWIEMAGRWIKAL